MLQKLEKIFKMEREEVEAQFTPYFYRYFRYIFESSRPHPLKHYSKICKHTFDVTQAKGKNVLDVGCGFGLESIYFAIFGAKKVVAIDLNEEKIMVFKKILSEFCPLSNVEVKLGDALELDFEDEYFVVKCYKSV